MAAAASLTQLFDFETQFEAAALAILQAAGLDAYISESGVKLPLISTSIDFSPGAALDELTLLPAVAGETQPSEQEYFRYQGMLEIEVSVNRDTVRQSTDSGVTSFLQQIRGLVRASFMRSQWPFYDTNLPYYRVSDIRPMGTTTGFEQVRNVDTTILRFQITFAIQQGAWPSGFPPS